MTKWLLPLLALYAFPAAAAEKGSGTVPAYLHALPCRIMERAAGEILALSLLAEADVDTLGSDAADHTFTATLRNSRKLTAVIKHVFAKLPRDRFNVTLLLDGKPHLRLNHVDLDIFVETTIEGQRYILHCFPWIAPARKGTDGGVSFPHH